VIKQVILIVTTGLVKLTNHKVHELVETTEHTIKYGIGRNTLMCIRYIEFPNILFADLSEFYVNLLQT
jgi:hypothetical protein